VAAITLCLPAVAQATTINVNTQLDLPGPGGCSGGSPCSLRQALAAANSGDTVSVPAGTYSLSNGELIVPATLGALQGAGASGTTINAGGGSRVLHIEGTASTPLTISGLTLTGGSVSGAGPEMGGAGVYVDTTYSGALTLSGDTITGNHVTATSGGFNGGAGVYDHGSTAAPSGTGDLTLTNTTLTGNVATLTGSTDFSGGGGVYNDNANLALTNATITGNSTVQDGAATSFNGGGGVYNNGSDITLTSTTVNGNSVSVPTGTDFNGGGGIFNNGSTLTLTGSSVNGNQLTLTANTSDFNGGGGIYNNGSDAIFTNSAIDDNTATITGTEYLGGIGLFHNGSDLTVTGSSFADNTGTITASSTTTGDNGGAGIYDNGAGGAILNSTLSGNAATVTSTGTANGGGALFGDSSATTVTDTTIAGNTINEPGGAILENGSSYTFKNTIIAGNSATPAGNCSIASGSALTSSGFNIESLNTCGFGQGSDHTNTDPMLAALADNGGPTPTQALQPGSPALGTGSCTDSLGASVTTDQRGAPRPDPGDAAGVCDIGAFEAQPTTNSTRPAITGTPAHGNRLTCSQGTWTNGPTSFTYQWNRNGTAIGGAVENTYEVQVGDAAATLTCTVTASGNEGPASATSAGVLVGSARALSCPRPTGKLSGTRLGPLELGMTLGLAEHTLRTFHTLGSGFVDFCLYAGFDIRAAAPSAKFLRSLPKKQAKRVKGRLVIALTANPFYSLSGVQPGVRISTVVKKLHLGKPIVVGRTSWYLAPGKASTGVLGVQSGVIVEIGIADRQLVGGSRKSQQKFMARFGSA
jgi:hypothetical protein